MIRLIILLAIVFLLVLFVRELKRYFNLDDKVDEFRNSVLEGELVDIDKQIALEKARQKHVFYEIEGIKSGNKIKQEEPDNG